MTAREAMRMRSVNRILKSTIEWNAARNDSWRWEWKIDALMARKIEPTTFQTVMI